MSSKIRKMDFISVVIPAYNEEKNTTLMGEKLAQKLSSYPNYEIVFVDDGSRDATAATLRELAAQNAHIKYILLSRNFGHQAAIRAGLLHASGDAVIVMDADFQHPISVIDKMISLWEEGIDIVQTQRIDDDKISFFKRMTSAAFYKLINLVSDVSVVPGTADFRLHDRKVVDTLNNLQENEIVFRTVIPWLGFKTSILPFIVEKRLHGTTKYSLRKMTDFAVTGIISSSVTPLRLSVVLSAALSLLTASFGLFALVSYFGFGQTVPGWASIIIAICGIGSLQLFVLGVIGEYIGRVFRETRRRPSFIIADTNCKAPD